MNSRRISASVPCCEARLLREWLQELYGYLIAHYLIRTLMQRAAKEQGADPDRVSFTNTLKILRCRLPECPPRRGGQKHWLERLIAEIGKELLPPRRLRINPRVIKKEDEQLAKETPQAASTTKADQTVSKT